MNHENEEMYDHFLAGLAMCYARLSKVLLALELPIALESLRDGMTPGEMMGGIGVAMRALEDMPMEKHLQSLLVQTAVDWLAAIGICTLAFTQEEWWAMNAANLALARTLAEIHLAEEMINGNIWIDDSDDRE